MFISIKNKVNCISKDFPKNFKRSFSVGDFKGSPNQEFNFQCWRLEILKIEANPKLQLRPWPWQQGLRES